MHFVTGLLGGRELYIFARDETREKRYQATRCASLYRSLRSHSDASTLQDTRSLGRRGARAARLRPRSTTRSNCTPVSPAPPLPPVSPDEISGSFSRSGFPTRRAYIHARTPRRARIRTSSIEGPSPLTVYRSAAASFAFYFSAR